MQIDAEKLRELLESLAADLVGGCCDSAVFIGEVDGCPALLTVMTADEAEETHEYEGTLSENQCLSANTQGNAPHDAA